MRKSRDASYRVTLWLRGKRGGGGLGRVGKYIEASIWDWPASLHPDAQRFGLICISVLRAPAKARLGGNLVRLRGRGHEPRIRDYTAFGFLHRIIETMQGVVQVRAVCISIRRCAVESRGKSRRIGESRRSSRSTLSDVHPALRADSPCCVDALTRALYVTELLASAPRRLIYAARPQAEQGAEVLQFSQLCSHNSTPFLKAFFPIPT